MPRTCLLLAALLLAGCASGSDVVTTPAAPGSAADLPATAATGATDCDPFRIGPGRPLAASDHPTAVLRCDRRLERVAGDGEWLVVVHQRASKRIEELVSLLRRPPLREQPGMACRAYATINAVTLELDGRPTVISLPTDECQHALPAVQEALAALSWTSVERTPLRRTRSEAAVLAGCEQWKDMIALIGDTTRTSGPGPLMAVRESIRLCRYTSADDGDGSPTGGVTLTGARAAAVRTALAALGPARPCTQAHTRFAVLDPEVYVELDGCLRVLTHSSTLRQGDAALVALLED